MQPGKTAILLGTGVECRLDAVRPDALMTSQAEPSTVRDLRMFTWVKDLCTKEQTVLRDSSDKICSWLGTRMKIL